MKGYEIDPANKRIAFYGGGDRVTMSTDGTMLALLPESEDFNQTINVNFPDVSKTRIYLHQGFGLHSFQGGVSRYPRASRCVAWVGARPQEWSSLTTLAVPPAGVNFIMAMARVSQTKSPSHNWGGWPIERHPPENQWIPFTGSILLETTIGMSRAASVYLDPVTGNLVLHRQQSVASPPGGITANQRSWGDMTSFDGGAIEHWQADPHPGWAVWAGNGAPNRRNSSVNDAGPFYQFPCKKGGSMQCSTNDPTDYSTRWQFELRIKFGRRPI